MPTPNTRWYNRVSCAHRVQGAEAAGCVPYHAQLGQDEGGYHCCPRAERGESYGEACVWMFSPLTALCLQFVEQIQQEVGGGIFPAGDAAGGGSKPLPLPQVLPALQHWRAQLARLDELDRFHRAVCAELK